MIGRRFSNNFYLLGDEGSTSRSRCMIVGHKRMGHINYKPMKKIIAGGFVRGIHELKGDLTMTCGDCHIGKQTKTFHKSTSHINTTRPLELFIWT